jgi:VanZ like family
MFHKLIVIVAWTVLGFIVCATISPVQYRPTTPLPFSIERLAAFAVLGSLFCVAYPRYMLFACLIVVGSAVLLEFVQLLTPDRDGRIQDLIEKMAGGAMGIVIGRAIVSFERSNRWFGVTQRGHQANFTSSFAASSKSTTDLAPGNFMSHRTKEPEASKTNAATLRADP